jgi:hypothetical protein
MGITVDLNGPPSQTNTSTAFTEQTIVTLFPSATVSTNGSQDSNSIDTVTITLGGATGTESLSLNATAVAAAAAEGIPSATALAF